MIPEFELDRREVRSAFERAAATYDEAAVLQREIAGRLLERLDYVRLSPVRVLDVARRPVMIHPVLVQRPQQGHGQQGDQGRGA